jgi:hypothetical protein
LRRWEDRGIWEKLFKTFFVDTENKVSEKIWSVAGKKKVVPFLVSMVGDLLETDYDSAVDFTVTPNEIISTHRESGRPEGII